MSTSANASALMPLPVAINPQLLKLSTFQDLLVTRYVTIAGIVVLIWDLILCFPVELKLVWQSLRRKWSLSKAGYVVYRYSACIFLLVLINEVVASRDYSNRWCGVTSTVLGILIFLSDAIGHGLIVFRIFVLWNRNRHILWLVLLGSAVVNGTGIAFIVLTVTEFGNGPAFIPFLHACFINIKPKLLIGIWVPQILFDVYVLFLVLWNAFDRPRLADERLSRMLRQDGLYYVLATWALRIFNLILCSIGSPVLPFIGLSFTEALITTINSRLLLKIFKAEDPRVREEPTSQSEWMAGYLDDALSMDVLDLKRPSPHSQWYS